MIGTISLTYPWVLATLPLAAVGLAVAYFRRRDEIVTLPSTLLLQKLPKLPTRSRRFSLPLIALLELLLILILILGGAGLRIDNTTSQRAIIIDNSPSMSLKSDNNLTLLDIGIEKADKLCRTLTQVEIYVTNPNLRSLTKGIAPTQISCQLLSTINIEYGDDNLNSAVANVLQNSALPLTVFSDHRLKPSHGQYPQNRLNEVPISSRLESNNVAILNVTEEEKGIRVSIASFSAKDGTVEIVAESVNSNYELTKVFSQTVALTAGEQRDILVPRDSLPTSFAIKVSLNAAQHQGLDLIEFDNSAWLRRQDSTRAKLVLVSPTTVSMGDLPVNGIRQLGPEEFQELIAKESALFDGFIFHKTIPKSLPDRPALLISPPSSPILPSRPCSATATPSRWHQDHPLTRYVIFPKLQFRDPLCLSKPSWAETLLAIPSGDIAIVGKPKNMPLVALGFEIFPFDGKRNLSLSVFTLNVMQWLFGKVIENGWVSLTDPQLIDADDKTFQLSPKSASKTARSPGLYLVSNQAKGDIIKEKVVAANFFSEYESNVLYPTELVIDVSEPQSNASTSTIDYSWLITYIAISFFLLEWLLITINSIGSLNPLAILRSRAARKPNWGEQ